MEGGGRAVRGLGGGSLFFGLVQVSFGFATDCCILWVLGICSIGSGRMWVWGS